MQLATAHGEAPTPDGVGDVKGERKLKRSSSFARALGPTLVCVYALLVLKTAQQGFMDSLPLITVCRSLKVCIHTPFPAPRLHRPQLPTQINRGQPCTGGYAARTYREDRFSPCFHLKVT